MKDIKDVIKKLVVAAIVGLSGIVFALSNKVVSMESTYNFIVESLGEIKSDVKEIRKEIKELR